MKIEKPTYSLHQGHPLLDVILDGHPYTIDTEQKPTLVRHGLVSVPGSPYTATLPDGQQIRGVSDDPHLYRLAIAFGLNCYHKRFTVGPASDDIGITEFYELGLRLEPYALPGARPMIEYLPEVGEDE